MGLTRLAVNRPLTVLMGLLGLVLMGGVAYTYLRVDRLPPITIGFVSVSVSWPQASADDVEQKLAEPIENALSGMAGVNSITSTSSEGRVQVSVQLADGTDPNAAQLDAQRRVASIQGRLPPDASAPNVNKADPNAQPIMEIALTGAPLDQLYDIASNQIQPDLQSIQGVGAVNISGGLQREIQLRVDNARLAGYGVSVAQISQALTAANVATPIGNVPNGAQTLNIRASAAPQSINDLANIIVAQTTGGAIRLGDVASIEQTNKDQTSVQRLNGQDAVGLSISMNSDANTIQVADDTKAEVRRLQALLPPGTQLVITNDQSTFTRASLDAIQHDLALAVLLVGVVVLLFLHEWRHTVIVLCAIPTSLITTFLVMYGLGFSLNTMSMMALALMIGILVDDSIVVLENIHRHLEMGEQPKQAALNGRGEIGLAAIAITAADVVVYTPIAFMNGTIGQLFRQYGLTVVAATVLSLLVSFTLTPLLASRWLKHETHARRETAWNKFGGWWDRHFDRLGDFVARSVPTTVRLRGLVLLVGLVGVVGAASLIPLQKIGMEYAPSEDDNQFTASLTLPPGTSLQTADTAARQLEADVQNMPEVQYYFETVSVPGGTGGGFGGGGSSRVSMDIQTYDKSQRTRSVFDLIAQLRTQARQIPGTQFSGGVASPLGGGGGGGGASSVAMTVSGPDLNTLDQVTQQVQSVVQSVPGVVDVAPSNQAALPELEVNLDLARMAALGVTAQQVESALRTTVSGSVVSQYQPVGQVGEDITLVAVNADRYNLADLQAIPVGVASATTASTGTPATTAPGSVTLGQVATLSMGQGPVQIQRINRNRSVTLNATAFGRPLGQVAGDVQQSLKQVPMPPGYSVTLRGQVQQFNTALTALGSALVLSVILEYMLLVALYESFLFPLVRMLTVPLGMIGALLALWLTGNTINIFSIIGMIMGEGLVAKSGILLVDYANTLRERGVGRTEALQDAVRVRLRPILMTSATMIFGMLPLALKLEPGAESRAPMAVVVIGGLLSSTFLTLVVVPALYTIVDDLPEGFRARLLRRRPPVEPAHVYPREKEKQSDRAA